MRRRLTHGRRLVGIIPARTLVQSFNYAFEGIIYVLATQRNMRIHFAAAVLALSASVYYGIDRTDFMLVFLAATFVISAEMMNTAIEATIDVSTTTFNPLAKLGKDVAAGAVLIATVNALVIGYLVFGTRIIEHSPALIDAVREAPAHITFIALSVTLLTVIGLKALTGKGTALRGGFPSGHAALAFAVWMALTLLTSSEEGGVLVSGLVFFLALLVAHTRVESGVHTWREVVAGAFVGSLVTLGIFQLAAH